MRRIFSHPSLLICKKFLLLWTSTFRLFLNCTHRLVLTSRNVTSTPLYSFRLPSLWTPSLVENTTLFILLLLMRLSFSFSSSGRFQTGVGGICGTSPFHVRCDRLQSHSQRRRLLLRRRAVFLIPSHLIQGPPWPHFWSVCRDSSVDSLFTPPFSLLFRFSKSPNFHFFFFFFIYRIFGFRPQNQNFMAK